MAYDSKDLSVLAYANGFTLWHYTSADLHGGIATTGYFNEASDMLRVGDIIVANAAGAVAGFFLVSSNAAGVVDVNDMTLIGSTDTN